MRAVNLIPADQRRGAGGLSGRSNGAAYAVLALVGGVALLALLYGRAHRQVSSRGAQVTSLHARARQAQTAAEGLAPYTNFVALRDERERAVVQLVDSRFDWAHAFHELGRVLPSTASVTAVEGTVGSTAKGGGSGTSSSGASSGGSGASSGAGGGSSSASTTVASATPPGSVPTFTINGCATSQAEVARTLNRLRLIDGVSEVTLQSSTKAASGGGTAFCPLTAPAFAIQVTFDPLPAQSAITAAAVVPAANTGSPR